jgi:hypothetical protein
MRIPLLGIASVLVLCACSGQPADSGVSYAIHGYSCCTEITGNNTWHAGQHVTLHWQPQSPGTTTNANPHQIVLTVSLTGPFPSVDALKQATSQGSKPAGAKTINADLLAVNDRTSATPASQLDLPSDLPPGYYNLATQSASAGLSAGGAAVVDVVP